MLFLNKKDITGVDRSRVQSAVKRSYELMYHGRYNMPDRVHVGDGGNTLLLMPCFAGNYFATKLVSVFPGASDLGLPVINGIMTLADNASGKPLAVMDGAAVTAERTGAVGGLAVSLLTDPGLKTAGIFGAGVQGISQARYLLMNRDIDRLVISDLNPDAAGAMTKELARTFPAVDYVVAADADDLVAKCQLIIAATTSSVPLFSNDRALVKDKVFISIGSFRPDMKEFPDAVIETAEQVFVDTPFAEKESGDICQPLENGVVTADNITLFSDLVNKKISAATSGTCFFKSVGMALFDLSVASMLYELAKKNGVGTELEF